MRASAMPWRPALARPDFHNHKGYGRVDAKVDKRVALFEPSPCRVTDCLTPIDSGKAILTLGDKHVH